MLDLGLLVLVRVRVGLSSFNSIRLVHTLWFFHSQYSRFIIHLRFNDFEYAVNLGPEAGVPILVTVLVLTLAHRRHYTAEYLKVIRFVEYRFLVVGTISLIKLTK